MTEVPSLVSASLLTGVEKRRDGSGREGKNKREKWRGGREMMQEMVKNKQ